MRQQLKLINTAKQDMFHFVDFLRGSLAVKKNKLGMELLQQIIKFLNLVINLQTMIHQLEETKNIFARSA